MKRVGLMKEWKSIFQVGRMCLNYTSLVKTKQGAGQRIILFPGFMSSESSMLPIKHYLRRIGYQPEYWGLGINTGDVEKYRDLVLSKLKQEATKEQLTLVGWSLGGVIAREVARAMPQRVNSVFTFGSPIKGPEYTVGYEVYGEKETNRIAALLEELDKTTPIITPMTIVFSKKDNVVSWPSCLDISSQNAKHYEVSSTHLSMVIDPQIWELLALHLKENLMS